VLDEAWNPGRIEGWRAREKQGGAHIISTNSCLQDSSAQITSVFLEF